MLNFIFYVIGFLKDAKKAPSKFFFKYVKGPSYFNLNVHLVFNRMRGY